MWLPNSLSCLLISLITVQVHTQTIYNLISYCNRTLEYEQNNPIIIDADRSYNSSNPCKLIINATNIKSNGFILRFNFNLTLKSNSFSINIIDHSSNFTILNTLNGSNLNETNLMTVNSSCFEINLKDSNQLKFELIQKITITAFNYTKNDSCNKDEFKCIRPLNTCISAQFECDQIIKSCSDDSYDHCNQNTDKIKSFTIVSKVTETTVTTQLINNSTTGTNTTGDFQIIPKNRNYNLVGIVSFLLILLGACLLGIIVYGRRKRKWREFLAQLDNNTDWEYEQLEDMPIGNNGDRYMSTVFDRTISSASESERENKNNFNKNNEQTPIANSST